MKINIKLKREIDKLSYFFWRIQATLFFFLPLILGFNILIYLGLYGSVIPFWGWIMYSCFAVISLVTAIVMPIVLIRISRKIIFRRVKKG